MQPTGSGIIEWRQAKGKGAKRRGKQFIELWTEFAGSRRDKAWRGTARHGRSQVCVGKKRIRIRTKVCYDFSHRPGSLHRRALSLSIILSSCCCTFPFPHAPKSTKNFLLSTRKKAATKHTQNFCHMRRKRGAAAWGMRHRMQAAAGRRQRGTASPTVTRSGMTNFTIYCEIRTQS